MKIYYSNELGSFWTRDDLLNHFNTVHVPDYPGETFDEFINSATSPGGSLDDVTHVIRESLEKLSLYCREEGFPLVTLADVIKRDGKVDVLYSTFDDEEFGREVEIAVEIDIIDRSVIYYYDGNEGSRQDFECDDDFIDELYTPYGDNFSLWYDSAVDRYFTEERPWRIKNEVWRAKDEH